MKRDCPDCIHLSYGKHAPKSYGCYCLYEKKPALIDIKECKDCRHYKPDIRSFDDWYYVNKVQLKGITKETAHWIWDCAISVSRRF